MTGVTEGSWKPCRFAGHWRPSATQALALAFVVPAWVTLQEHHVLLPQRAQHRRRPQCQSCPVQAALGGGEEEAEGPPRCLCPPSWRRATAAAPRSCRGIHHPARAGGTAAARGEQGGGRQRWGRGTARGRAGCPGAAPAAPAVHVPCTRGPAFAGHRPRGVHAAGLRVWVQGWAPRLSPGKARERRRLPDGRAGGSWLVALRAWLCSAVSLPP